MAEHVVATEAEFSDRDRIVTLLEGREIGVFEVDGEYHAVLNWCVHQGGPCCEGTLTGTREATYDRERNEVELDWVKEGRILSCPWHGWEYHLRTGLCLSRQDLRLPSFPVEERDGEVVVSL